MIPDLGKYAGPVLAAYGGSIALYLCLVFVVIRKNRLAKRALDRAEAQLEENASTLA
jgi:heme exporter protein D